MLESLQIHNVRNITQAKIKLCPSFNVLYGQNGSGKTSILEAIYHLSFGRSFRTRLPGRIINHEAAKLSIFGQIKRRDQLTFTIGIERHRGGDTQVRLEGENISSTAILAREFPLQLIEPGSHRLLTLGPKQRRQFMDWGVFHVELSFLNHWQRAYRALKQRNAALKGNASVKRIALWDDELVSATNALTVMRSNYLAMLKPIFNEILTSFLSFSDLDLSFKQGWPQEQELANLLKQSITRDIQLGYTQYGPHRADLQLRIGNIAIQDVLSQGQLKLVVYALRLSQGIILQQHLDKACVFLIDDLAAELDKHKRAQVISVLANLKSQVFITATEDLEMLKLLASHSSKMFHVEQGTVKQESE